MDSIVYLLLIGLCAGWLAGQITKGGSFGVVNNLIVGVIGAVLGGVLFRLVGLHAYGLVGQLVIATVGALVLLYLMKKFGKN